MQQHNSIYGLVGNPVQHSLSPFMHNAAFQELGVDAVYKLFPLQEDELEVFFSDLKKDGSPIFGLNVTVPYKEKVLVYMDSLSPFAEKVGAVNTVVVSAKRKLTGHNTDGPGFLTHLTELGFDTTGKRVSILGAGGAARAIVTVLCLVPERPEAVFIYDIDHNKATALVQYLGRRFDTGLIEVVKSLDDLNLEISDLLINTTPIGMRTSDPCLLEGFQISQDMLVYDLIYNPAETRLLKWAKEQGAKTSNGLGMLFYQGVLAFQHWAEIQLDKSVKDKMWASLKTGLKS
ncbi:MAG: shikimate dehydrogenase [Candidatus Omnitrophota bacterium]